MLLCFQVRSAKVPLGGRDGNNRETILVVVSISTTPISFTSIISFLQASRSIQFSPSPAIIVALSQLNSVLR